VTEADRSIDVEPAAIRPAMPERIRHTLKVALQVAVHDLGTVEPKNSEDAAHAALIIVCFCAECF
jgi:hypothetical protein